jgi:hypothetical protein
VNEKVFAMVLKWHFQTQHKIAAIVTLVLARHGQKMKYYSLEFPIFS